MTVIARVRELVDATHLIDTHEHLLEEADRLANRHPSLGCGDWSVLLSHYTCADLCSSGLPEGVRERFCKEEVPPEQKFRWIERYWKHVRHTGYGQAVRLSLQGLYGESDLTLETVPRIAEKYSDYLRPGFYDELLRQRSLIDHCQVNSVQSLVFKLTSRPDLLRQDIDITELCRPEGFAAVEKEFAVSANGLDEWLAVIDKLFAQFAPLAVAVKCFLAYFRRLDFAPPDRTKAEQAFTVHQRSGALSSEQSKVLGDFLFDWCLNRAQDHRLPVKIHTGYHDSNNRMPLHWVSKNVGDLCEIFRAYPATNFVLFHIGYPYQNEVLAVAKQYSNVVVDMCFAWIVDPLSSTSFLKAFLTTVPANKLFSFGGDYIPVELVHGHARLARMGIARALSDLIEEGWLGESDAPHLIECIMRRNAEEFFSPAPKRAKESRDATSAQRT
jgi:hypothetical protein